MKDKVKSGTTISCIGGLFTIFSMTTEGNQTVGLIMAILGVVFALGGLLLIQKGQKENKAS